MKSALLFILTIFFNFYCAANNSQNLYFVEDSNSVVEAFDIVKGEVLNGTLTPHEYTNACFSYSFELNVEESYKGKITNQIVHVGLNLETLKPKEGGDYLLLLQKTPSTFFDYCKIDNPMNYEDVFITFGYVVGFYEIREDLIYSVKCNLQKPILFEDKLVEQQAIKHGCKEFVGKYKDIVEQILRSVN